VRIDRTTHLVVFWKFNRKEDEDDGEKHPPVLRYYTVFNVEQCDGLTLPPLTKGPAPEPAECDRIIAAMPNPPSLTHDGGDKAYYHPASDSVHLPPIASFSSAEGYYSTAFHELGHSTGHASRLNRHGLETGIAAFGSPVYSREELAAEFAAAFLCATASIEQTIPNSTAYIASWLKALQDDKTMAVIAAGQGQRAADYILGATT
jgi:antirestriction protein ArdC